MTERESKLRRIAEAIADDLPIEWKDAGDPWLDPRMRNLRELEKIRVVYRDIESDSGELPALADRTAHRRPSSGATQAAPGKSETFRLIVKEP